MIKLKDLLNEAKVHRLQIFTPGTGGNMKFNPSKIPTGKLKIGNQKHDKLKDSTLILFNEGDKLELKAVSKSEFLFIAGKPIGEPIARGGPFVMNTKEEIIQAVEDYKNGTFAKY